MINKKNGKERIILDNLKKDVMLYPVEDVNDIIIIYIDRPTDAEHHPLSIERYCISYQIKQLWTI